MDEKGILLQLLWNNTTDSSEMSTTILFDYHTKDHFVEIRDMVWFIAYPILIIFGTFGNLLVFVVMRRGSLKHVSTCFYMSILGLADTGEFFSATINYYIPTVTWVSVSALGPKAIEDV